MIKITGLLLAVLLAIGIIPTLTIAHAQPANMNNTNITVTDLAQNVTGNVTVVPLGNVTLANMTQAQGNQNQNQNQTQAFQALENSTAILNQQLESGPASEDTSNTADRAEIRRTISQGLSTLGAVADKVVNATSEQLRTVQTTSEAISEAIDQLFDE